MDILEAAAAVMARLGLPANLPEMAEDFLDAINAALKEQALSGGTEHAKLDELTAMLKGGQGKLVDRSRAVGEIPDRAQIAVEMALHLLFSDRAAARYDDGPPHGYYWLLDEQGDPVPTSDRVLVELLLRSGRDRAVGKTTFVYRGIKVYVSTVFLVLNHAFDDGPPVLWETMIFTKNQWLDGYQERYRSRIEAEAGHARATMMAQKTLRERRLPSPRRLAVAKRRICEGRDVLRRQRKREE